MFKKYVFMCLLGACTFSYGKSIEQKFNAISSDPVALYAFLKQMPKGGELHYHLDGGAYPETMIDLATEGGYCLDKVTNKIMHLNAKCAQLFSNEYLLKNANVYQQLVQAWSMKDFIPLKESKHDHFFNSFFKFSQVVSDKSPELLAEIIKRAANQNEHYMEIMMLPDGAKSAQFYGLIENLKTFKEKRERLLNDSAFMKNVSFTVNQTKNILNKNRKILGCDKKPNQKTCQLTIKFQYFVLRELPIDQVFSQALNVFLAASLSEDVVGVNLVMAEDGHIALRDYKKQLAIFKFMHEMYPTVHIALHAGELAPGLVKPRELRFHINDALKIGQAQRIGHGVDIAYENNSKEILQYMAKNHIPVEINLTSNREILSVFGNKHPIKYYLNNKVPIVLSTDDEGILRTDLTQQYVNAVIEQGIDYKTLKQINRNTLTYSFLPGQSIWINDKLTKECEDLNSNTCKKYIKNSQKAQLQWKLENNLFAFEKGYGNVLPKER